MLSVEIRVNGNPIGQVSAYRGAMVGGTVSEPIYVYPYRASFFPLDQQEPSKTYGGKVMHSFNLGIEKLAAKILADVAENSPPVR